MNHRNLLAALLLLACALTAADFRYKVAYGKNSVNFGLGSYELTTPYIPPYGSTAARIYFTYGGDAADPDAKMYQNLATHQQCAATAATWTLYAENADSNGTVVNFTVSSGQLPSGATLKITEIGNDANTAVISAGATFVVETGRKYAVQYAEAGKKLIPPAPENLTLSLLPALSDSCQMTFDLPDDTDFAAVVDDAAVAYSKSTDGDLVIAAKNVGTIDYDDTTGVCTFTLPAEVLPEWEEIHFNYRFSDGKVSTGDGLVVITLVQDTEYKLQFKAGTTGDKLLPAEEKDINVNSLKYDIVSNESWTVSKLDECDWLALATTRGFGSGTVYFSVTSLDPAATPSRICRFVITSESGLALECSVTQLPWPGDVTQSVVRVAGSTVKVSLDVPADASFKIAADAAATAYTQDDSGKLVVAAESVGSVYVDTRVSACTYTLPEEIAEDWAELHFTYNFTNGTLETDKATVALSLTDPPYLRFKAGTVTPKAIPADVAGLGELQFDIESNEAWTVKLESPCDWLQLETTSGRNSAPVYFTASSNLERGTSRTNSFIITSASGKSLTFTVFQQAGQEPRLTLSPEAIQSPGFQTTLQLQLDANVDWMATVVDAPEWAALDATEGDASQVLNLTLQANTDADARTCQVTVASVDIAPTIVMTCTVTQNGRIAASRKALAAGWNLVALECYPADLAQWLPDGTAVYAMESNAPVDAPEPGKPYWIYSPTAVPVAECAAYALPDNWRQTVVQVGDWLAVGVAKSYSPEAGADIWTWSHDKNAFVPVQTVEAGKAYWIRK